MLKKIAKRKSIIQAVIKFFGQKNFQNSGISEIPQRAGVAEGTMYQCFKNKEDFPFLYPIKKTKGFCSQLELHLEGVTGALN
jgi:TetR/AcrR family transcriptional regulator, fatty acid metabolism regulator protein